jgi:hypothetical protein
VTPAQIHADFARLPGAEQCASRYACEGLAAWLRRRQPRQIVEVGGGIGTLSAVILATMPKDAGYTVIEPNAWCREQWDANILTEGYCLDRLTEWITPKASIDFLVVDGGDTRADYYQRLAPGATMFVEGNRRPQRAVARTVLAGQGRRIAEANFRPPSRSKGFWIVAVEPDRATVLRFRALALVNLVLDCRRKVMGQMIAKRERT